MAGTSQFLALTTLSIQRYRKYKKPPQLNPKKDTKICYLQCRLQAVINSSHLLTGVSLPSRAFSHVRGHLRLLRFFALRADARSLFAVKDQNLCGKIR